MSQLSPVNPDLQSGKPSWQTVMSHMLLSSGMLAIARRIAAKRSSVPSNRPLTSSTLCPTCPSLFSSPVLGHQKRYVKSDTIESIPPTTNVSTLLFSQGKGSKLLLIHFTK